MIVCHKFEAAPLERSANIVVVGFVYTMKLIGGVARHVVFVRFSYLSSCYKTHSKSTHFERSFLADRPGPGSSGN